MQLEQTYLADAGEQREPLAAWRLFSGFAAPLLMKVLDLPWPECWCLLRIKTPLMPDETDAGDMDFLAGRLLADRPIPAIPHLERLRLMAEGQRSFLCPASKLTIDVSYVVGGEIKCAYVGTEFVTGGKRRSVLKSVKDSKSKHRKLRVQLNNLLQVGVNRVYLVDVIAGLPAGAMTVTEAISRAALSTSTIDDEHDRLKLGFALDLPIGHIEVTVGAIGDATEDIASFCRMGPHRRAPENPLLREPDVVDRRKRLVEHVEALFATAHIAPVMPVVFDLCPRCRRVGPYHGKSCTPRRTA